MLANILPLKVHSHGLVFLKSILISVFSDQSDRIKICWLNCSFYKELINKNINSITEIENPDLDKVKMANGNIVKID